MKACLHPVFAWGDLVNGGPLAWTLSASTPRPGRIRGTLWHLPSGGVAVVADDAGTWIRGDVHPPLDDRLLRLVESVLGADMLGLERIIVPVLIDGHTVRAMTWTTNVAALRRLHAVPLAMGDWAGFHGAVADPMKKGYPSHPAPTLGAPRGGHRS